MPLEDSIKKGNFTLSDFPEPKPLGSPDGRFAASPLADTKMGPQQFVDKFAREDGVGLEVLPSAPEQFERQFPANTNMPTIIDGKEVHAAGTHNEGPSTTFGTYHPAQLSKNDPFGDL